MSIEARRGKGGYRYTARIKHKGRTVAVQTFDKKTDAATWEREQYRALEFGEFLPPARSKKTFDEVVEDFLESRHGQVVPHTWRTDRDNLANTPTAWSNLPIGAITEADILAHLTRQLDNKAHSTVARARTSLSALFQYAVRERLRQKNPVRAVPMPAGDQTKEAHEVNAFTDAELASTLALQSEHNPWMSEVTEFLSLTGLRWSELRAARVRHLHDLPYPALRVSRAHSDGYAEKGTMTKTSRPVPLTSRALAIAQGRAAGRKPNDYLFVTPTGKQLSGNGFRKAVQWSKSVPNHTIHDLRHFAASTWLRAGIPVHQVARWLGHKNATTTLRVYAHVLGTAQEIAALKHLNAGPVHNQYTEPVTDPNLRAALHPEERSENAG